MALKTVSRVIGDFDVDTTHLPARRAIKLAGKLGRVIAPALSKTRGLSMQSDLADLAPVLTAFFSGLEDKEYDALLLESLASTVITYGEPKRRIELSSLTRIDEVFGDDMSALVKVFAFVIEVNFKDFMSGVLSGLSAAPLKAPPAA